MTGPRLGAAGEASGNGGGSSGGGLFLLEPALGLLLRRKLRGTVRRTLRRMRTPRGAILTLFGLLLLSVWVLALVAGGNLDPGVSGTLAPSELRRSVRLGALVFFLISIGGAFVHRGLFLPKAEIERLFASPLRRSDLVRYRLLVGVGRSLLGGLLFALLLSRRLPHPVWGYFGVLVAIQVLPVVNQFLAILMGRLEARLAQRLRFVGKGLTLFFGILAMGVAFLVVTGRELGDLPLVASLTEALRARAGSGIDGIPAQVHRITLVFEPWARLLTATNAFDFFTWLAVCGGLWLLLFECTARLPVDFRELSLETSANIAARLRRAARGGGAASGKARRGASWMRVPWWLGRGPTRAVAWRKGTTILRKARGTLWVSVFVLLFVTLLSSMISGGTSRPRLRSGSGQGPVIVSEIADPADLALVLLPSLLIAGLGVLYLSGGLRFDFREDLDRMESMRSWPIPPARLFLATVLPQVVLVSLLVFLALGLRVALTRDFHPALLGLAAFVPPFALAWVALDNAVFLFLPVRITPGQGGMIPNAGRAFLVIFLRMALLGLVLSVGGAAGLLVQVSVGRLEGVDPTVALGAAAAATWGALLLADVGLLWLGGGLVRRFDVARDARS